MKKNVFYKAVVLAGVVSLCSISLLGCKKKEIAFTTGLKKSEVMKIDGVVCTVGDANLLLYNLQRDYIKLFGNGNWDKEFGDETIGSYVKSQAIKQLSQIKSMAELSKKSGNILSKTDQEMIKNAADEYLNSIDKSTRKELDIKEEDVIDLYTQYCHANKFYQDKIDSVNKEISDDEARVICVEYIYFNTNKFNDNKEVVPISEAERNELNLKILSVMERINAGENFEKLANEFTDDDKIQEFICRGQKEETFEKAAFDLTNDQVSDLVENDNGVYIIKCISNYDEEKTIENKKTIYTNRCKEALNSAYSEYLDNVLAEFNEEMWKKFELNNSDKIEHLPDFFGIYGHYFELPSIELII